MGMTPPVGPPAGRAEARIAGLALAGILVHLFVRYAAGATGTPYGLPTYDWPLVAVLALGGLPLVFGLGRKLVLGQFGSDLLAGISIVTSVVLGEYLAGSLVVLMLSGGAALEAFAVRRASSALAALARQMPSLAH